MLQQYLYHKSAENGISTAAARRISKFSILSCSTLIIPPAPQYCETGFPIRQKTSLAYFAAYSISSVEESSHYHFYLRKVINALRVREPYELAESRGAMRKCLYLRHL